MKKYNISYERNNVSQAILVEAVSAEVAERYFKHETPDAKFYSIYEATVDDMKPGKPVMRARPFREGEKLSLNEKIQVAEVMHDNQKNDVSKELSDEISR